MGEIGITAGIRSRMAAPATIGGARLVDAACVRTWLEAVAERIEVERHYLTQLDAAIGDADAFGPRRLLEALRAALAGVQRVGAAAEGDKTMVDALAPGLTAFEDALRGGHSPGGHSPGYGGSGAHGGLEAAARQAHAAAVEGMRATIPMQARKGRASYLGPRSVGHQDPGATSTALMFAALEEAVLAQRARPQRLRKA
ncbi:MAG TPA: DAK2 domain-containing protein [Actinomycetota bacterium]